MLRDDADPVAALALDCIALLCAADVLDFYGAWPVVVKHMPSLPHARPLVARKWVALLAHGALDAKAVPTQAAAALDLLWLAARDKDPQVVHNARSLGIGGCPRDIVGHDSVEICARYELRHGSVIG